MFLKSVRAFALLILYCNLSSARAQAAVGDTTAEMRMQALARTLATADSIHDIPAAINARLDLAALSRPSQAWRLANEAAALADSSAVPAQLALRAHRSLVDIYTAQGEMTKANREWAQVAQLLEHSLGEQATEAVSLERKAAEHAFAQRDSLSALLTRERGTMQAEVAAQATNNERLLIIAGAVAGGLLIILCVLAFVFLRKQGKQGKELKDLRQEVAWLRLVAKTAAEAPVPVVPVAPAATLIAPVVVAPPPPVIPTVEPVVEAPEDTLLLALVQRRGLERLQTLRDARARGDNDKVVRVVHTMKPQLVSLDAPYFQDLCARLVNSDPQSDPASWAADLDRFETGMARVLGQRG